MCLEYFVDSVGQDSSDEELEYCKRVSKLEASKETAPAAPKRKVGRPRKYPREDGTATDEPTVKKPKFGASRPPLGGTTVTNKL